MVEEKGQLVEKRTKEKNASVQVKPASRFLAEIHLTETIQRSVSDNADKESKQLIIEIRLPEGSSYEDVKRRILQGIEMVFKANRDEVSKISSTSANRPIAMTNQSKLKEDLSEILKALRERTDLTMEDLAKKTGVTVSSIAKWEKGVCIPRTRKIIKLAEIFEVPVQTFYEEQGSKSGDAYVTKDAPSTKNTGLLREDFPHFLKSLRRLHLMRQQNMAERLGVSKDYISRLERADRKPGINFIKKLVEEFGISIEEVYERL